MTFELPSDTLVCFLEAIYASRFTGCCNRGHVESDPANITAISFEIVGWGLDFLFVF